MRSTSFGQSPSNGIGRFRQFYHLLMIFYCSFRLFLDRVRAGGDTRYTYLSGSHLDQLDSFRLPFIEHLNQDPARVELWRRDQVWIDHFPDIEELAALPPGSLGGEYAHYMQALLDEGYIFLRDRRFEILPEEALGLNRDFLARAEGESLLRLLTYRRNIYMTSTHDFIHFLTGSDTRIAGEALVARYQYRHTRVGQNWMNMQLSLLAHYCLGRWSTLKRIRQSFAIIDQTPSFVPYDWERSWPRPLHEVRRELGLPETGFMPWSVER